MKIILFDFDETIIDHSVWAPARNAYIAKLLDIDLATYKKIHEGYKANLLRPEDFTLDGLIESIESKTKKEAKFINKEYFNK